MRTTNAAVSPEVGTSRTAAVEPTRVSPEGPNVSEERRVEPEAAVRIRIETAKGEFVSEAPLEQVLLENEPGSLDELSIGDDQGFVSIRDLEVGQSGLVGGGAAPMYRLTRVA